jgi:hypothetical protein
MDMLANILSVSQLQLTLILTENLSFFLRPFAFALILVMGVAHGAPSFAPGVPLLSDSALASTLDLDKPGLEKVKAAVAAGNFPAAQQAYLDYRRTASPVKWKIMPADAPKTAVETTDKTGDEIVGHVIRNTYGFNPKIGDMGKDFNWLYNPVPRGDPRFSDEWTYCVISRTQFWQQLADAYWKTLDEKYAREWVAELKDFAVKNPVDAVPADGMPSLWRSLDSGVRMHMSWPYTYVHFLNSPSFTPEANWLYLNEIHTHGTRLAAGLADPNRSGNWVTTECFGLYTLAVLFPELKESAAWQALAMDRMNTEVQRVVPPDGFESELSPNYHTVAMEGFVGVYQLALLNQQPVPEIFHERIPAMYRALVMMMQQNGKVVPTNDSMEVDAVKLAQDGAKLSDDPIVQWAATGGKSGTAPPLSAMLPYAGFYVMRGGWDPKDFFLFFRGGPTGTSHQHEDMNEIVLRAYGHTFLADPGNALYDHSDWRRYIINSASHNTIMVDGKWQHRGSSHFPAVDPVHNPWITTPLFDFVSATYDAGYQENDYDGTKEYAPQKWVGVPDKSVSHTRRVLYLKPGAALVVDTLDGTGNHVFDAHFHLSADHAQLDPVTQAVLATTKDGPTLGIYPLDRDNLQAEIIIGQNSPLLGWSSTHQPMPTLRYRKQQGAPATFSTLLVPSPGPAPTVTYEGFSAGQGLWARRIKLNTDPIEVIMARSGAALPFSIPAHESNPAVTAKAAGLVVKSLTSEHRFFAGGWDVSSYDDGTLQFTLAQPGAFVAQRDAQHLLMYNPSAEPLSLSLVKPYARTITLPSQAWEEIGPAGETPASAPALVATP